MPTGNLPSSAKAIYERVYKQCRDKGMSEEESAKRAWGAVKNAGYSKDAKGVWHKNAELSEFSLTVTSTGLNKETGARYWKASTSDIFADSYNDEMSLELYKSFIQRILSGNPAPEEYQVEGWTGGMPYVSVSHYQELAGTTDNVYVDGAILKAKGVFLDTPLGRACFDSLWDDVYGKRSETEEDRIRVSIAFLDYKHRHKATGNIFVRSNLYDVCPECVAEKRENRRPGKVFLDGLLVHFAMTRVPVNGRTLMEVEKSMTTKKQDAASIVGENLAEELEEKERSLVGKSEAEVIRSEDESPVEERSEDEDEYRPFGGATTLEAAHAYITAGKEQRRVGDIMYAFQCCLSNIASSGSTDPAAEISSLVDEFKSMIKNKDAQIFESLVTLSLDSDPNESSDPIETGTHVSLGDVMEKLEALEQSFENALERMGEMTNVTNISGSSDDHPLSIQLSQLRSDFDQVVLMDAPAEERLRSIQVSFDALGEQIRKSLISLPEPAVEERAVTAGTTDPLLLSVLQKLSDKIDLLSAERKSEAVPQREIPRPRSIPPSAVAQQPTQRPAPLSSKSTTPVLTRAINRSVGLED